ncbi:unnamed protein product [Ixodes hexagonus]
MEQSSKAYPLAGFAYDWDWRPLEFESPPNPLRVCSSCCVIPKEVLVLPCRHVLCAPCYSQAEARCPLDHEAFDDRRVERLSTSLDDVAGRLVWCWNRQNGCAFNGMLIDMANHFYSKCPFHAVQCFKCNTSILRTDMASHHLKCSNETVKLVKTVSANCAGDAAALGRHIEDVRKEVGDSLKHFSDFQYHLEAKLNSLTEHVHDNAGKKAEMRSAVIDVLRCAGHLRAAKTWRPRELALLVSRVDYYSRSSNYREEVFSVPSEVCGYSLRLGASCQRDNGELTLDFMVQFCKSPRDPCLCWPFRKPFTLALVHPYGSTDCVLSTVHPSALRREPAFEMPGDRDNPPFSLASFVRVFDKKEFWREGTLQVCFEVKISDSNPQPPLGLQ